MKEMHLVIVSPERMVFDGEVSQVTLPGQVGEFQILKNHAPLISALAAGKLTYTSGTEMQSLNISGGFVEVSNNQISVCAEL
ncbi:ATP synthase F1 subunit epsilon [Phocaeicola faecicola]|jgi:F-type H+-transporting ATPase subunit epsilon|uniref:ATP synthase F1 subunit epsilon n=1 Tax=Phocaeicola faecicola TaxID=2739389 RepID=UPI0015B59856|nr:ATP synthase F1 subunit epsilon [Phocaeicola faecicola]MCI5742292.1 ATP synthase F1 subunit epsilon [Bacteroides sp.]MDD6907874.1 ATP synthase F1 subunit epsilon [Bacteroidaceae bacterium]MDY4872379.1 ATP synthase F1 subunit epsilon [Phocaeicola faecicola]